MENLRAPRRIEVKLPAMEENRDAVLSEIPIDTSVDFEELNLGIHAFCGGVCDAMFCGGE